MLIDLQLHSIYSDGYLTPKELVNFVAKNGVKVAVRGDQVIQEIEVDGIIENRIAEVINDAVKKTQELAARKLIEISSQQQ